MIYNIIHNSSLILLINLILLKNPYIYKMSYKIIVNSMCMSYYLRHA